MTASAQLLPMLNSRGAMFTEYPTRDWAATAVGHPASWPALLRNAVGFMLDSQFPMFIVWGPELAFLYNAPYIPLLGPKHPNALGTSLREVWPELWDDVNPLVERALAGEPTFHEDIARVIWRDGRQQECWFTLSYSPIRDVDGSVPGALCVINETTARVRLEQRQALQLQIVDQLRRLSSPEDITQAASELLSRHLCVPHVLYTEVDDTHGCFEIKLAWASDSTRRLAGYRGCLDNYGREAISLLRLGQALVISDVRCDVKTAGFADAYAMLGVRSVLALPLVKDGRLIATLNLYDSEPHFWSPDDIQLGTDIAERTWSAIERVRAEAGLRESAEHQAFMRSIGEFHLRLADILRRLSDSRQIFSKSCRLLGRFLKVSRVLCGDYDSTKQLVTFHSEYHAGRADKLDGAYPVSDFGAENFATLERGETWISEDMEHDPRTAGRDVWPTFKALNIYSGIVIPLSRDDVMIACLFIGHDSPRRWKDVEVRVIKDAAERIWNAVERARAEEALRQASRRKDQFLAMLAHELRNPLAPISTAAQLLKMAPIDPDRIRQTSDIIARQVEHMTGLVDDLLDVSRVTRGLVTLSQNDIDIRHVISDAVEQVRPLIDARRHQLIVHMTSAAVFAHGDYKRLVQVFANLLNNAAKYTPEGGKLLVWAEASNDQVVIGVSDNGIGITAELLPTIFNLFSQAKRTPDRSQGGLGLGLALVKSLVELHGGTVSVTSDGLDAGSEFTVRLPRLHKQSEEPALKARDSGGDVPTVRKGMRILVVDDNVDAAQMLSLFLQSTGYTVSTVHNSIDALRCAEQHVFDVYLLDIGLPGMDGNELARHLRTLPTAQKAVLVAITGYGQQFDREAAMNAGFDHYIVKPADPQHLVEILSTAVL